MGIKERNKKRILRKLRRPMMCFLSATFACSSILFAYASNIETDKTVLSWQWDIDDDSLSPLYVNNNDELVLDLSDKEELTEDDIADYLPQYIKADIMTYTEQTEEPIDETEDKPMDESVDEPTEEMIDETVDKPTSEPIDELMDETVNETIDEPADELIEETTDEHTEELIDDPVDEPNEPIEEPVVGDTADKPTDETVGEPENELIDEPKDEPTDKMPKRIAPETTVYEEYIDITWDMSEIPEEMEDEFVLTASLPKGYSFGSGVPLPFVTVLTGGGIDGLSEVNPDDLTNGKYALVIGDSKAAMLAEQKEVDGKNGFAAIAVDLKTEGEPKIVDDSGKLAVWEFEKITDENGKYYVKTETDGSYKYLKIDNANITLVDTEAEASAIEIQIGSGDNVGKIRLAGEGNYAPNLYGGSIDRGFAGYNGGTADPNEWFYPIHENRVGTVKTVPGVSPNGTAITLFDYWLESEDSRDDRGYKEDINLINSGINQGHALKFLKDIPSDTSICGAMNTWTRSAAPYQGIVKNKLVDGYPYLNEDIIDKSAKYIKDCEAESLDYLFDPKAENAYRRVYQNAQGMLRVDEDGYYRYDCKENFAELDKETNTFTLYEAAGVTNHNDTSIVGQFFPFNKFADVSNEKCNSSKLNHYFGLTMKTRFVQKNGGMTENDNPAMFEFSGDDDVWIFIDDVLVADLGGNHDAVSVNINFVTGEVVINEGTNVEQKTTLYDQFGKVYDKDNDYLMSSEFWTKDETTGYITFADNTCHTFKFFYLERGNYASNMNMKYNFAQIPSSEFLKVDQYGEGVEGAELSLYAAEIDEKTGEYKIIEGQDPIYYGVTDSEGKLRLVDEDGLDMSFDDLVTMSDGKTHFVLKEVVPDGYRAVGTGVNLKIVNGTMVCENTINSGAWASANVLATAPDKLNLANKNVNIGDVVENGTVNFIDDGNENGSLFAVVLKYVGPRNDDGAANPADQGNLAYWRPVHGDPVNGYQLEEVGNEDKSFISAVIKAASEYNGNVFQLSQEGSVQCNIEDLPGDIRDYYYMLKASGGDAEAAKAEYTVAYYWTSADIMDNSGTPNWDKVTSDNTFQVSTSGGEKNKIDRTFGVNLKIPNVNPRIVVQKQNESEDRLNDTTFAMYRVKEEDDGKIYYLADDGSTEIFLEKDSDGDNKGEASVDGNGGYTYTVDEDSGVITVSEGGTEYKISPAKNAKGERLLDTTRYEKEIDEGGSVIFSYISNGQYYIREIKAPDGYSLNTNEIMAYSTPTANFINAGTADDGISVGRSPGPLIDSLSFMASKGDIDNTLSWIYSNLSISDVSDKFSDVTNDNYKNTWRYITEQYASDFTAHTTKNTVDINGSPDENGRVIIDDGRKAAYLVYQGASEGTIFNYVHNKGRDGSAAPLPYKNRAEMQKRLWTNIGWSYLEIYQDTNYGREYKKDNYEDTQINVGYTELEGENIRHLFANSVFVMVTDKGTGNLEVSKTVNGNGADKNKSFTFTVSLGDNSINGDYGEMTFTDGRAEFTLKDGESKTAEGLPERTSYTVKESDNRGYILTAVGAEGKIKANDTVKAEFTNTKTEHGGGNDEITVKKIWDDDDDKKEKRPDSVMVQLYCDGKAFGEEVELSEENNWMCKWENLDGQCEWTAKEVPVPDGYTSITRTEGNVITITNMLKSDKPDKPGKPLKPNEPDEPDAPSEPDTPDTPIDTPDEPNIPTEPDEPIPDEPLDNTPRTGDTSLTSLYLTIMVASFIGMCAVVLTGRLTAKKEYKKRH